MAHAHLRIREKELCRDHIKMHPLVRDLYKRVIILSKTYPGGPEVVRRKAKEYFSQNSSLATEEEILKAVARGRYYLREIIGITQLSKYRFMKNRYESS